MFQVAGVEVLEGQVVQSASARFNLLSGRGQTGAIDQGERPAAVDLRLIDQGDEVAVVGVGLQGGNVIGQLLCAGGAVDVDFHVSGGGRFRGADQHRVAVAAEGRERLRINVQALGAT